MSLESSTQWQKNSDTVAHQRLTALFDPDTFLELDGAESGNTGTGVVIGCGEINGGPAYAFAQDPSEDHGAVGTAHAGKILKLYDLASKTGAPVIALWDSHGVRLDEGFAVMAEYGKILAEGNNLSGVVPQISVVMGTCAGVSAMIACSADFVVMEKDAELFLTAPFTAAAAGEKTEGAGTAENAVKAGVAHLVCDGEEETIRQTRTLVSLLPGNNLAEPPVFEFEEPAPVDLCDGPERCACNVLRGIADAELFICLQKGYGAGAATALGTVAGRTTGFVATVGQALTAEDCGKIARFVRVCDAFSIPIVTLANTPGFLPSSAAELSGSIRASATLAHAYAEATCPKISVVTGEVYGAAYIALAGRGANADAVVAWPSAVISALSPEASVEILSKDLLAGADASKRAELTDEYRNTQASPYEAAKAGQVDLVVTPEETRNTLIRLLDILGGKRVSKLPKKHGNMPL